MDPMYQRRVFFFGKGSCMSADDFFSGWFFMVFIGPILGVIHAVIALPSTLFSKYVSERAGFITWILTLAAILAYIIFPISSFTTSGRNDAVILIVKNIILAFLYLAPQAAAYPLTRNRPWWRPLVAGGLAIGVAILYMTLGFLLGATPD
jgi:hypothetical protein